MLLFAIAGDRFSCHLGEAIGGDEWRHLKDSMIEKYEVPWTCPLVPHPKRSCMPKSAKRLDRIEFRANDEDRELVEQLTTQYDLTMSDLIRVLLKQAAQRSFLLSGQQRVPSTLRLQQIADLYRQLSAMHTVLDRVKTSNGVHQPDATIVVNVALMEELDELIQQIQKLIVQMFD